MFLCIDIMIATWVFVLLLDSFGFVYGVYVCLYMYISICVRCLSVYMILVMWGF